MRALIIGCGYVGTALAGRLQQLGHEVTAIRLSADPIPGIRTISADISQTTEWSRVEGEFDWIINLVSSNKGGADEYQKVYLEGNRNLIQWANGRGIKKIVYASSTSVYAQKDGSAVKESSPTEPTSDTSKILVEAEKILLQAAPALPCVVLRVAGIYGPERGHLFKQYLKNEARIPGKGERIINMIHRDDLAEVIISALKNGRAGEVYNAVDDEPVPMLNFFRWLAETLGKWMPPFVSEEEEPERKRAITSKKVQNRKMKVELGVQLKYPTFRQGYTTEIQRLDEAGQLNIEPEPR